MVKEIIKVENLSKIFGKNTKRSSKLLEEGVSKEEILKKTGDTVGVNRTSFSVYPGEIFVIMGLSGSGKSTLIRLINRLIEPTSGSIYIDGEDLAKVDKKKLREIRQKKFSMVFQNFALFPHRTVLENAAYGLELQKVPKAEREKKAKKALKLVGLEDYGQQKPNQLSGGMQQRVGLARALANDSDVLLMDEAFSALDPLIRKDMQDELIELQEDMQKTILFITHDLNEALRLGDRIVLMRNGSIVQVGTPEEILMNPANAYVERFVADIDRSKILNAQHIMNRAQMVNIDNHGPRVALEKMREEGVSGVYVVDSKRNLIGYVTADAAGEAVKENKTLKEVVQTDIPKVDKDTPMTELINIIHDSPLPLAVVENNRLLGVVIRGSVIAALSEEGEVNIDG